MENNYVLEEITYTKKKKFLFELRDIFAGTAFPFMISVLFSATIIAYSSYRQDLGVSLLALIGGEALFIISLVIFGRANGAAAYRKFVLNEKKRQLNSSDERAVYHTGEYALWKGALIGFLITIPFIIIQIIELIASNVFCSFCLEYIFAWAYCPFSYLGERYEALSFIMVLMPVAVHMLAYYLGKIKEEKIQEQIAVESEKAKKKKRRK